MDFFKYLMHTLVIYYTMHYGARVTYCIIAFHGYDVIK